MYDLPEIILLKEVRMKQCSEAQEEMLTGTVKDGSG